MIKTFSYVLFFISLNSYTQTIFNIIPAPVSIKNTSGYFQFDQTTYILANDFKSFKDASAAKDFFISFYELPIKVVNKELPGGKKISISYDSTLNLPDEGYQINITQDEIRIVGKNNGGVFHGFMSLLQLIENPTSRNFQVPCLILVDYPRFQYRGMHLDCARHFFEVDFIKKYIDYLALYKYNTFHWHLTDDQGWRIEIKQYPKLTEIGAWRDGSMIGHYRDQQFDSIRYGGFYSQKEIKEIVKYAEKRNITIIPEIEMPGHCLAALAAYPEFGCVDDTTYTVGKAWGGFPDVFCPKEETFIFLENILDEVMALFPSEYIHIGGDEVEKTRWKESAFCQQLMKENKLKDENELQSYFIQRIEKYVNAKGKKIIGWDEILEGGIAPNATIMSWRGEEGGIEAAKQNHFAIMTPGSYCYFDHYQGSPTNEPIAIGGFTPIEKVYSYEPIPAQLNATQAKYILGAQANVWTEYINTAKQVEYMALPRMLALSEVLWSEKENKNYDDFVQRLLVHFKLLDRVKCNYSKTIYELNYKILPSEKYNGIYLTYNSLENFGVIYHYSNNSSENLVYQNKYLNPIFFNKSSVEIAFLKLENINFKEIKVQLFFNKATGKKITLTSPPSNKYAADGAFTLVNGIVATTKPNWTKTEWLGFSGTDCEAIIDLGKTDTISKITVGYLEDKLSWIWKSDSVEIFSSVDGINFKKIALQTFQNDNRNNVIHFIPITTKFIKVKIMNYGLIPSGNPGAGNKAWLFVDEISIE